MRRSKLDLAIVIAVALLSNFTYLVASNGDFFFPDSKTYLIPAASLLHGEGLRDEEGNPDTLRTPGYPLFLVPFAGLAATARTIVAAQHLLVVALAAAVYLFTRTVASQMAALLAGIFVALDVPTIHMANKVLSETLFTVLLFALFVFLVRIGKSSPSTRSVVTAALLCGALVLVRPVAIAYFIVPAIFLARALSRRSLALFVAVSLFLPVGWAIRNRLRSGIFTVSSIAGINMLQYRAAGALAILDGGNFKEDLADRQQELSDDADDEIQIALHIPDAQELPIPVRASWYSRIGRRIVLAHPLGAALMTFRGFLVNCFDPDSDAVSMVSRLDSSTVDLVVRAWTHLLVFLAAGGIAMLARRGEPRLAGLLILTILYYLTISAGGEAEYRFRVPVVPMLAIAAAVATARASGHTDSADQPVAAGAASAWRERS